MSVYFSVQPINYNRVKRMNVDYAAVGQRIKDVRKARRLTQEQLNSLSEHDRLGAAAFILVSVELQDFYRVPWGVWRDMRKLYGHKHMNKAELEPFRVQYIAGVLKLLEGIELEYGEQEETL